MEAAITPSSRMSSSRLSPVPAIKPIFLEAIVLSTYCFNTAKPAGLCA